MKLNPAERVNLLTVVPTEVSVSMFRILRDLQYSLSFTEEERKRFFIESKLPNGDKFEDLNPDPDVLSTLVDVPIGEEAKRVIVNALKDWDKKERLRRRVSIFREDLPKPNQRLTMLDLYERFVEDKKTAEDIEDEAKVIALKKANADVTVPVPVKP